ncbi:MAG: hypothetical protein EBX39_05765 [Actinobacteria bacterium]|nr:hypothetical protein [Actinomycetota bacterium]
MSGAVEPPIDPEPPVVPVVPVDAGQLPYTGGDSTGALLGLGSVLLGAGLLLCGSVLILGRSRRRML